ncbi:MAG: hypothetical protein ACYTJ0_02180 [Planctomycetota bacterium]|jgi:ribonuclease HII
MLIFAGIDEAGYGPMLGPLCVGCTVLEIDAHDPADGPPNVWSLLRTAVCRRPSDKKRRVAVDDSKRLKGPADGAHHPLRHLERGVLSFSPGDPALPPDDESMLARWGVRVPEHPWLTAPTALPVGQTAGELQIARGRVQRAMERAGLRCGLVACRAIDAAEFNREVESLGNKAELNFKAAVDLLELVWSRWADDHPRVVLDRHGGRTRYGDALARALPGAEVEVIAETASLSRYVLRRSGSSLTVSFAQGGDERFFPVCLASMVAKYVRELFMLRLNRYFQARVPELRPTAGYVQDARRYLRDIAPVVRGLDLARRELVRSV